VIEKIFSFREASASFQAERFFCSALSYRSAGDLDLACKRPVRPITGFFLYESYLFLFHYLCVLVRRATSFSILNLAFFLGNEVRPEGTVPPIVGGVGE
jgi:hypothetical protein